jgi:hypothetical protein
MSDKSKKILKWSLTALAVLAAAALVAGLLYWNHMLNLLGSASDATVPTLSYEEEMALLGETDPVETTQVPETTEPRKPNRRFRSSTSPILCWLARLPVMAKTISFPTP